MRFSGQFVQWQDAARRERARLLTALGRIGEGGIVVDIQHIGSTSVPGLAANPCVDLAVAVDPFPLDTDRLATVGYFIAQPQPSKFEQRALHTMGNFQLFICEPGSDEWTNHLLLGDYLSHDEDAQWLYAARKLDGNRLEGAQSKDALFAELLTTAHRWWPSHYGFRPVEFVAHELEGFPHSWYISSGWALDLFMGHVARLHHDVDVVVARADQLAYASI